MQNFFSRTSALVLSFNIIASAVFLFPQYALALSLSPSRISMIVDPGKTGKTVLTVTNDSDARVSLAPAVDSFTVDPETGSPIFGNNDPAVSFVEPQVRLIFLDPRETRDVDFVVRIPENALPETHNLGLFLEEAGNDGQIRVASRVGALLFLSVAGEHTESLQLVSLASASPILFHSRALILLTLQNTGSLQVIPEGTMTISNWRGKKITELPLHASKRPVLAQNALTETYVMDQLSWRDIGKVDMFVDMQYGLSNQHGTGFAQVWYVPWWSVVMSIGVISGLLTLFVFKRKHRTI